MLLPSTGGNPTRQSYFGAAGGTIREAAVRRLGIVKLTSVDG